MFGYCEKEVVIKKERLSSAIKHATIFFSRKDNRPALLYHESGHISFAVQKGGEESPNTGPALLYYEGGHILFAVQKGGTSK